MRKISLEIMLFLVLISTFRLVLNVLPTKASDETIYVDDDNVFGPWNGTLDYPYRNITSGLMHASTGETIFVYDGTYYEHLTVNKSVSITGQNRNNSIIDGSDVGTVIEIGASNVRITNFTIQNSGSTSGSFGIYVHHSSNNTISHNIIKSNYNGICIYSSENNTLFRNNITLNKGHGAWIRGSGEAVIAENIFFSNVEAGIYVSDSADVNISGNNVLQNKLGTAIVASYNTKLDCNRICLNNQDGIYVFASHNTSLTCNDIHLNNRNGVNFTNSTNNILSSNNIFENYDFGLRLSQSSRNFLYTNNISSNHLSGIYAANFTKNVVTGNSISKNIQHGIWLEESNSNTISGNIIRENIVRGMLLIRSSNNVLFHNNFINNTKSIYALNSTNILDIFNEGNFWSEYNGTDTNKDGVGDTDYAVDEYNIDRHPLLGFFYRFNIASKEKVYSILTICNSTISNPRLVSSECSLTFNVSGLKDTVGFCRMLIPEILVSSPYVILVDDQEVNAIILPTSNATHTSLYFEYNLSNHEITIVSQSYYELLKEYENLQMEYGNLASEFDNLKVSHEGIQAELNLLTEQYENLSSFHNELLGVLQNYTQLLETLESLKANLEHELRSQKTVFTAAALAQTTVIMVLVLFLLNYYARVRIQRKDIEALEHELEKISMHMRMEQSRALFALDVGTRKRAIEKFEKKYHLKIRPHDSLEEIFESIKVEKEG